jgi:hypothetical protein
MEKGVLNGVAFLDICKVIDSINYKMLLKMLKDQFAVRDNER